MATTFLPRKTYYKGIQMRSRLEATMAGWLDRHQFAWTYEPSAFGDERGTYLPDFKFGPLPSGMGLCSLANAPSVAGYMEVKPPKVDLEPWRVRMETIWASQPDAVLVIAAPAASITGYSEPPVAPARVLVGLGPRHGGGCYDTGASLRGGWNDTWGPGWFGRCRECDRTSLYLEAAAWCCHHCGHEVGAMGWEDLDDWPYLEGSRG